MSYEDDQLQQGIFSYFLAKGLSGEAARPDGLVTFQDLSFYVTQQGRMRSAPSGHLQVPYEAGEASGDLLLASASAKPAAVQTPAMPTQVSPLTPAPTGNISADDMAIFQAAVRSNDPDQMEAAARKVSNTYMANGLRVRAARLRGENGSSNNSPISSIIPNQTSTTALSA